MCRPLRNPVHLVTEQETPERDQLTKKSCTYTGSLKKEAHCEAQDNIALQFTIIVSTDQVIQITQL